MLEIKLGSHTALLLRESQTNTLLALTVKVCLGMVLLPIGRRQLELGP